MLVAGFDRAGHALADIVDDVVGLTVAVIVAIRVALAGTSGHTWRGRGRPGVRC